METTLKKYITTLKIDYSVNSFSVIILHQLPYAFYYIDKSNLKNNNELLKLREKVKQNHEKFLIFIWWDLWLYKTDTVKSKIKHIVGQSLKIHARKTIVKQVNKTDSELFFITNHLNQPLLGYKRFGLYLNNELIALASFAKKRKFRDNTYSAELLQFSTKNGIHINGGLSKLTTYFSNQQPITTLMTYVDKDWSNAKKFERIGFIKHSEKSAMYFKLNTKTNNRELSLKKTNIFNLGSIKTVLIINKI